MKQGDPLTKTRKIPQVAKPPPKLSNSNPNRVGHCAPGRQVLLPAAVPSCPCSDRERGQLLLRPQLQFTRYIFFLGM